MKKKRYCIVIGNSSGANSVYKGGGTHYGPYNYRSSATRALHNRDWHGFEDGEWIKLSPSPLIAIIVPLEKGTVVKKGLPKSN